MNETLDKQTLTWYYVVSKERDATVSKDWRFTLYDRTIFVVQVYDVRSVDFSKKKVKQR